MVKIRFICESCNEIIDGWLSHFDYGSEPPENEEAILLHICSCESAGVYGAYIECPKCGTEHDVFD